MYTLSLNQATWINEVFWMKHRYHGQTSKNTRTTANWICPVYLLFIFFVSVFISCSIFYFFPVILDLFLSSFFCLRLWGDYQGSIKHFRFRTKSNKSMLEDHEVNCLLMQWSITRLEISCSLKSMWKLKEGNHQEILI